MGTSASDISGNHFLVSAPGSTGSEDERSSGLFGFGDGHRPVRTDDLEAFPDYAASLPHIERSLMMVDTEALLSGLHRYNSRMALDESAAGIRRRTIGEFLLSHLPKGVATDIRVSMPIIIEAKRQYHADRERYPQHPSIASRHIRTISMEIGTIAYRATDSLLAALAQRHDERRAQRATHRAQHRASTFSGMAPQPLRTARQIAHTPPSSLQPPDNELETPDSRQSMSAAAPSSARPVTRLEPWYLRVQPGGPYVKPAPGGSPRSLARSLAYAWRTSAVGRSVESLCLAPRFWLAFAALAIDRRPDPYLVENGVRIRADLADNNGRAPVQRPATQPHAAHPIVPPRPLAAPATERYDGLSRRAYAQFHRPVTNYGRQTVGSGWKTRAPLAADSAAQLMSSHNLPAGTYIQRRAAHLAHFPDDSYYEVPGTLPTHYRRFVPGPTESAFGTTLVGSGPKFEAAVKNWSLLHPSYRPAASGSIVEQM